MQVRWAGKLYVDGGIHRNLPLDAFVGSVLALTLRGDRPEELAVHGLTALQGWAAQLSELGSARAPRRPSPDLVRIGTGNVGMTDFGISRRRKIDLIESGFMAVSARLHECNHDGVKLELPVSVKRLRQESLTRSKRLDAASAIQRARVIGLDL